MDARRCDSVYRDRTMTIIEDVIGIPRNVDKRQNHRQTGVQCGCFPFINSGSDEQMLT